MAYLYIVDDDQTIRSVIVEYFESRGHEVATFASAESAMELVLQEKPDIVLLDVKPPGMDPFQGKSLGFKLIRSISEDQLLGSMEIPATERGLTISIRFPLDNES